MTDPRSTRAFHRKARRALRRMTKLQRDVFLAMRFEQGVTYAVLAIRHGIPASQVQREFALALHTLWRTTREPEPWWRRWWPW
ncbi:MAG: iron dicitrate transport regulator FecR [Proteobacteria bacterium]|nr:MAG: iron dicitrate transport regulator FecR [Pseudomonadota bacterium]